MKLQLDGSLFEVLNYSMKMSKPLKTILKLINSICIDVKDDQVFGESNPFVNKQYVKLKTVYFYKNSFKEKKSQHGCIRWALYSRF